ncbi:MAG: serine acetyltransferase [Spirochaetes bacterium]|nr:serine acetyltransferase [Spirochaetota bacterium]
MPSIEVLEEIVELLRSVMFPGYFGNSDIKPETMRYYLGAAIDRIFIALSEQIKRGLCFTCTNETEFCEDCDRKAREKALNFLMKLSDIRRLLSTDVIAAFEGDPATESYGEIIFCYPSITALTNYRIAHELFKLEVPFIPRIITEMAHSQTGIDINPEAVIGEKCFIDHGTGVVIGATCILGKNIRIYQGVTLGAKSFDLDEKGNPVKGIPRHPIVEDDVVIYSGATILGRVTLGKGAVIGGNVWLTRDVPAGTRVLQGNVDLRFENGAGI